MNQEARVVNVSDGDTITVLDGSKQLKRVRLNQQQIFVSTSLATRNSTPAFSQSESWLSWNRSR